MSIIGIFLTLFFPSLATLRERAEQVVCMGHLRSIHCALSSYLNDHDQWPQFTGGDDASDSDRSQFWYDTLQEYGVTQKDWHCPTLSRLLAGLDSTSTSTLRLDYEPTNFNESPMAPRQYPTQPWLVEHADMHHSGRLIIFADGSVQRVNLENILSANGL